METSVGDYLFYPETPLADLFTTCGATTPKIAHTFSGSFFHKGSFTRLTPLTTVLVLRHHVIRAIQRPINSLLQVSH